MTVIRLGNVEPVLVLSSLSAWVQKNHNRNAIPIGNSYHIECTMQSVDAGRERVDSFGIGLFILCMCEVYVRILEDVTVLLFFMLLVVKTRL